MLNLLKSENQNQETNFRLKAALLQLGGAFAPSPYVNGKSYIFAPNGVKIEMSKHEVKSLEDLMENTLGEFKGYAENIPQLWSWIREVKCLLLVGSVPDWDYSTRTPDGIHLCSEEQKTFVYMDPSMGKDNEVREFLVNYGYNRVPEIQAILDMPE